MKKTAIIGLSLIGIMFLSSIAFAFLQSVPRQEDNTEPTYEIPENYIVRNELTQPHEAFILSQGFTIMKYFYASGCIECGDKLNLLESITLGSEFTGQIVLEEIQGTQDEKLEIFSNFGSTTINGPDINSNSTIDGLCEISTRPPAGCALRDL